MSIKKLQIEQLLAGFTSFDEAKTKLLTYDNLQLKENEDLCLVYHRDPPKTTYNELEIECRSYIFDKKTLKTVSNQFPKIEYNADTEKILDNKDWKCVDVQTCYEGTMLCVFYHNTNMYVCTRRCLDAKESKWVKNMSHHTMFLDTINNKFKLTDLDQNLCHYFVLVHHENKNIISYEDKFGKNYKEIIHICSKDKDQNTIEYNISGTKKPEMFNFDGLDALKKSLQEQDSINFEGYVLKLYDDPEKKGNCRVLKMQTKTYQTIKGIRPNNSNIFQVYLELYQRDKLHEFLDYYPKYKKVTINRISQSIKTLSQETLLLYHATRGKKNAELYARLGGNFKTILYKLHGLYLGRIPKNPDVHEQPVSTEIKEDTISHDMLTPEITSITVHDVYHLLKNQTASELRNLFLERYKLITEHGTFRPFTKCPQTWALSNLMLA